MPVGDILNWLLLFWWRDFFFLELLGDAGLFYSELYLYSFNGRGTLFRSMAIRSFFYYSALLRAFFIVSRYLSNSCPSWSIYFTVWWQCVTLFEGIKILYRIFFLTLFSSAKTPGETSDLLWPVMKRNFCLSLSSSLRSKVLASN